MAVSGVCKPLSRKVVRSSGQGNCTFDCQSGNFAENYGSGNHVACVSVNTACHSLGSRRLEVMGARKNGRATNPCIVED